MTASSHEARWAVWLVDPGPNRAGILALVRKAAGLGAEAAADCLVRFPALVGYFETETAARDLVVRLHEFDAVAVVRPGDQPLAPAPVEEMSVHRDQRGLHAALVVLGVIQIVLSAWWFQEGRPASAFFGLLLGLYVTVYFGLRLRR